MAATAEAFCNKQEHTQTHTVFDAAFFFISHIVSMRKSVPIFAAEQKQENEKRKKKESDLLNYAYFTIEAVCLTFDTDLMIKLIPHR